LLQETIDASPVAITIKDRHKAYVFANRTALDKFGLTADEVIGHTLVDTRAFPETADYMNTVSDIDDEIFASGIARPLTGFSTARNGAWRESLVSKTPINDASGQISHIVTVSVDVTELKDVEARALALKEEAELANAAKSMFLANMSHELRTPLNAIIGFSEVLMGQMFGPLGNDKYVEYARDIHQSGDHLHAIITDLLDVARIEVGAIDLDLAEVDLASVLHETCTMLRRKADKAGVALVETFEFALPVVMGDAVRLRQIFINLVDNAIKFTDSGGEVRIGAAASAPGTIAVTVADTGVGIDRADIEQVVEPFVHLTASSARNVSGTGLGLSLVKSLSELHGGAIDIDSEPGRGTVVTVTLPCAAAPVAAVGNRRSV
jgi:PAS domain S-box-containing protein